MLQKASATLCCATELRVGASTREEPQFKACCSLIDAMFHRGDYTRTWHTSIHSHVSLVPAAPHYRSIRLPFLNAVCKQPQQPLPVVQPPFFLLRRTGWNARKPVACLQALVKFSEHRPTGLRVRSLRRPKAARCQPACGRGGSNRGAPPSR